MNKTKNQLWDADAKLFASMKTESLTTNEANLEIFLSKREVQINYREAGPVLKSCFFCIQSLFPQNEIRFSGSMFLLLSVPFCPVMRLA
jgi:hypothetical protein